MIQLLGIWNLIHWLLLYILTSFCHTSLHVRNKHLIPSKNQQIWKQTSSPFSNYPNIIMETFPHTYGRSPKCFIYITQTATCGRVSKSRNISCSHFAYIHYVINYISDHFGTNSLSTRMNGCHCSSNNPDNLPLLVAILTNSLLIPVKMYL